MEAGHTGMRCRHCNIALPQSRGLIDGEFCCDAHREAFEQERALDAPAGFPAAEPVLTAIEKLRRIFSFRAPAHAPATEPEIPGAIGQLNGMAPEPVEGMPFESRAFESRAFESGAFESGAFESDAAEPGPLGNGSQGETFQAEEGAPEPAAAYSSSARETAASWRWLYAAWREAPRDLKLISLLLPVLLVVAVSGSIPKVPIRQLEPQSLGQVQGQFQRVVEDHWKNLNETISDRAAVAFSDDFRAGLDDWESRSNLTRTWSYDASGFVRPGPLAIFKPTLDLTDYRFEFLGEIDQKAIGWAFRAQDLKNYYAMKFVVVKPGPLPLIHMIRYAVINGKEGPRVDRPLPMTVRTDTLYRVEVNARGSDFTILAQGQVVDFWSDTRLSHGGIGFFCNRGERARLRWVEVSHQYDALGRLCAYLAPYGIEGRNGIN